MLKKINLVITLLIFNYCMLFAQCDLQGLLNLLESEDSFDRIEGLNSIITCHIVEAIPTLEEKIYEEEVLVVKQQYLIALYKLESENLYEITQDFIGEINNYSGSGIQDILIAKVVATDILFSFRDYSTTQFIFDLIDRDAPILNYLTITLLDHVIKYVPNYSSAAKDVLIDQVSTSTDEISRGMSINILVQHFGSEILQLVLNSYESDESMTVRIRALESLFILEYYDLNNFLKENLPLDEEPHIRTRIVDSLLYVFGEPSDLKEVIDYQPTEPNETARSLMGFAIDEFIPPKPDTLDIDQMILQLISFTDDLYQYEWIVEEEVYNYYRATLEDLKNAYEEAFFDEFCRIIEEELMNKIEEDRQLGLITIEGYKFLHYHTTYIFEDFEGQHGPCH